MKTFNLILSVFLLASTGYANSHILQPGQTALVQKKNGDWIEIKTASESPSSFRKFFMNHPFLTGSALAVLGYIAYRITGKSDSELNQLMRRFEELQTAAIANINVPNHNL